MLDARFIVMDEARLDAPHADFDEFIEAGREVGWNLSANPEDARAEIAFFGFDAKVHVRSSGAWPLRRAVPTDTPFFWMKPLREGIWTGSGSFDWYGDPM